MKNYIIGILAVLTIIGFSFDLPDQETRTEHMIVKRVGGTIHINHNNKEWQKIVIEKEEMSNVYDSRAILKKTVEFESQGWEIVGSSYDVNNTILHFRRRIQ